MRQRPYLSLAALLIVEMTDQETGASLN